MGRLYPSTRFLDAIQDLIANSHSRAELCSILPDKRMPAEAFENIVARESIELLAWSVRKLTGAPVRAVDQHVTCLLPRQAVLAHLMRRALPFAAYGTHIDIRLHPESGCGAAQVLAAAKHLGVDGQVRVTDGTLDRRWPIVLTGKRRTAARLESAVGNAISAATGRCAVLLAPDRRTANRLAMHLSAHQVPYSCTRLRAIFLWLGGTSRQATSLTGRRIELEPTLRRLHPSIVLAPAGLSDLLEIAGFTIGEIGDDGSLSTMVGLSKDPVFGWPGDYTQALPLSLHSRSGAVPLMRAQVEQL